MNAYTGHSFTERLAAFLAYDSIEALETALVNVIYGSNCIDNVGGDYRTTSHLCHLVFHNVHIDPVNVPDLGSCNREQEHVVRVRREIIQHAQALVFMIDWVMLQNRAWSEDVFSTAHWLLSQGVLDIGDLGQYRDWAFTALLDDGDDENDEGVQDPSGAGDSSKKHCDAPLAKANGQSRQCPGQVILGPATIPWQMRSLVHSLRYHDKINIARDITFNPYSTAARFHHRFFNICPFGSSNNRMAMMLVNVLLIKYAGHVVAFGSTEAENKEYRDMMSRGVRRFHEEEGQMHETLKTGYRQMERFLRRMTQALQSGPIDSTYQKPSLPTSRLRLQAHGGAIPKKLCSNPRRPRLTLLATALAGARSPLSSLVRDPGFMPSFRIPYKHPLAPARIHPAYATTPEAALSTLITFLTHSAGAGIRNGPSPHQPKVTLITGAGLSVASGLADYRGSQGTYVVNKTYKPTYYPHFVSSHEARRRYWARSFLGFGTALKHARPNAAHYAIRDLGAMGRVHGVVTQNVDSFHPRAHPGLRTVELHGCLRKTVCVSCGDEHDRAEFQTELAALNPAWDEFLHEVLLRGGTKDTEDRAVLRELGVTVNPDGDMDVPNAPYTTFRYPPCRKCHARGALLHRDSAIATPAPASSAVATDADGAWDPDTPGRLGVLKPGVVMFGETVAPDVRKAAEDAVDAADRLLVLATSLATYSAFRLAMRAKSAGKPLAIVNLGGVRDEAALVSGMRGTGEDGVRVEVATESLLPALVEALR